MSNDPEFKKIIDTLLNSSDSAARIKAAKALGDHVTKLSDDEYEAAKNALNRALADSDPMVLTSAMQSITKYTRGGGIQITGDIDVEGDSEEDLLHPPTKAVCDVCGRPEALIPDDGCGRDDCPYR